MKDKNRYFSVHKAPKPFGEGWFFLERWTMTEDNFRMCKENIFGDKDSLTEIGEKWAAKTKEELKEDEEEFWRKVEESYKAMKADKAFWDAELEERKAWGL